MTDYYVDGVDGSNANAGTSEGSGNAWATIQFAEDNTIAGDKVWVKGNGDYVEQVTLANSFTASQIAVVFEGYTTTPGDNGQATIDATGNNGGIYDGFFVRNFRVFKNFRVTGATSYNVYMDTGDYGLFINCEFDNAGLAGVRVDNNFTFIQCTFRDNTGPGCLAGTNPELYRCKMYNNTSAGYSGGHATLVGCLVYDNQTLGQAVAFGIGAGNHIVTNNTIEAAANFPGLAYYRANTTQFWDNIFSGGSYGIEATTGTQGGTFHADFNLFFGQSISAFDSTITDDGLNNITGEDPNFTNAAGGDFTIPNDSPATDTGSNPGIV